jgi:hypothetical protein
METVARSHTFSLFSLSLSSHTLAHQVEKSPIVIKGGLKKEDAEALKAKLEAAGGKVSLE